MDSLQHRHNTLGSVNVRSFCSNVCCILWSIEGSHIVMNLSFHSITTWTSMHNSNPTSARLDNFILSSRIPGALVAHSAIKLKAAVKLNVGVPKISVTFGSVSPVELVGLLRYCSLFLPGGGCRISTH